MGGVLRGGPRRVAGVRKEKAPTASICLQLRWGGVPQGAGGGGGFVGRFGLGGSRPDPGLLVPSTSRQEAEANYPLPGLKCWIWDLQGVL